MQPRKKRYGTSCTICRGYISGESLDELVACERCEGFHCIKCQNALDCCQEETATEISQTPSTEKSCEPDEELHSEPPELSTAQMKKSSLIRKMGVRGLQGIGWSIALIGGFAFCGLIVFCAVASVMPDLRQRSPWAPIVLVVSTIVAGRIGSGTWFWTKRIGGTHLASSEHRLAAAMLDCYLAAAVLSFLSSNWQIAIALFLLPLRDILGFGSSLGKRICGLALVERNGSQCSIQVLVKRSMPESAFLLLFPLLLLNLPSGLAYGYVIVGLLFFGKHLLRPGSPSSMVDEWVGSKVVQQTLGSQ